MEKTRHLFENSIYYIANRSVALNPMFNSVELQEYFKTKMEYHLLPLCDILAFDLSGNSFQLVVKLKDRKTFEEYFQKKKKGREHQILEIPDSTYLFSQAMANLQVSYVKHFNHMHNRSGTLMAARFDRKLIENEVELESWIDKLNRSEKKHFYSKMWKCKMKNAAMAMNSTVFYENEGSESTTNLICLVTKLYDLRGCFENLPPKCLPSTKNYYKYRFNLLFGPTS